MNVFSFTPMVRFDYSFPDVDQKTRSKIYEVIYDPKYALLPGGGGDGSKNRGAKYITAEMAEEIRDRLVTLGLTETQSDFLE